MELPLYKDNNHVYEIKQLQHEVPKHIRIPHFILSTTRVNFCIKLLL